MAAFPPECVGLITVLTADKETMGKIRRPRKTSIHQVGKHARTHTRRWQTSINSQPARAPEAAPAYQLSQRVELEKDMEMTSDTGAAYMTNYLWRLSHRQPPFRAVHTADSSP